jgi:hypothetical protein
VVTGIERFREHFRGFGQAYVLIGGAACDAWMTRSGLPFRKTKDLDIVLVIEAVTPTFVARFREFVEAGDYEVRQRQATGAREFHRFVKPKASGYPFMLELFSRAPEGIDLFAGQEIVPVPLEEAVASLSAILMEKGYYELVMDNRYDADGLSLVGVGGLVPLKARAWLDLRNRKDGGKGVDENDIKKHRNDVFRLALTLAGDGGPEVASDIRRDLLEFLAAFPDGSEEWTAVLQALNGTLRAASLPSPADFREAIATFFRLG